MNFDISKRPFLFYQASNHHQIASIMTHQLRFLQNWFTKNSPLASWWRIEYQYLTCFDLQYISWRLALTFGISHIVLPHACFELKESLPVGRDHSATGHVSSEEKQKKTMKTKRNVISPGDEGMVCFWWPGKGVRILSNPYWQKWSNEKNPSCLGYIGDYATQLYGDYNKPL